MNRVGRALIPRYLSLAGCDDCDLCRVVQERKKGAEGPHINVRSPLQTIYRNPQTEERAANVQEQGHDTPEAPVLEPRGQEDTKVKEQEDDACRNIAEVAGLSRRVQGITEAVSPVAEARVNRVNTRPQPNSLFTPYQ